MKKIIIVLLALVCINTGKAQEGFVSFNFYQLGFSTFNDVPIGKQKLGMNLPGFSGKVMTNEVFMAADVSIMANYLIHAVSKKPMEAPKNNNGYSGIDLPTFSWRFGKMYEYFGFGVDLDMRALYLVSNTSAIYKFNDNKIISDFNFGPVFTGFIEVTDFLVCSPTIGWDMMFTERQTTPVDGHLFLFENCFIIPVAGDWGFNIEPNLQYRRVRMPTLDDKRSSLMFALKFGISKLL